MRSLIALFFLVCSVASAFFLLQERLLIKTQKNLQGATQDLNPTAIYSQELAKQVQAISNGVLSTNAGKKQALNYLVRVARGLPNEDQRLQTYCKAFELADQLKKLEPYNSKILINWLYWQQILEGAKCSTVLTDAQRQDFVATAIKNDPTNVDLLYQAALLNVWNNNKEMTLELFNDVLLLATDLKAGQKDQILSSIESDKDFAALVPARFPQVVTWSRLLREKHPTLHQSSTQVVKDLQLEALKKSVADLANGTLPIRLHLNNLASLWLAAADDSVRQTVDGYIATTIGQESSLGRYLTKRAQLNRLSIVPSFYSYDSQPQRSAFSSWDSPQTFYFDSAFNSVGFYKKPDTKVKLIELHAQQTARPIEAIDVQVLSSKDNKTWSAMPFKYKQTSNPNLTGSWIALEPEHNDYSYLKVNYKPTARTRTFGNSANLMINAFG